jgi:hypothetical protein
VDGSGRNRRCPQHGDAAIELDPAAVLGIHIDGSAASLLEVLGGDVVTDESRLDVILDSPPLPGHEYLIVDNDGTSPVLGRLQGRPESGDLLFAVLGGIAYGFSSGSSIAP